LLWWHVIKWGINRGYHTLDLGGAGKPGKEYGVRKFKARFGGELVNYGRYLNVFSPALFKFAEIGYKIYQKSSKRSKN
jgi:lipid II:glycine glycyltransferase (peptidoglycan interpeptide bridge formation enzyme)